MLNLTLKKKPCLLTSVVGFLIITTNTVQAQTNNQDTIVVTADRTEKKVWDSAVSVNVVDREKIEKTSGDSIAEALRDIPGVEIYDNGTAGRKQIIIRGESPSHVLMLIDGQEVSYHRSGHGSGAGLLIDPDSIERIEVIKGPHSVLYGSQAIGGVINFITKKGSADHKAFEGHLKSTYDSSASGFTQLASTYGTIDNFTYRLSGNYTDYGNRRTPNGRLKNTDFGNKGISNWLGYTIDQHQFGLSLEYDNLHTQTYYDQSSPSIKSFIVKLPLLERKKAGLFYDYAINGRFVKNIHIDGYLQKLSREFRNDLLVIPNPITSNHTKTHTDDQQHTQGVNLQTNLQLHERVSLVAGAQYLQDKVEQEYHRRLNFKSQMIMVPSYKENRFSNNKWQQSSYSLFAQNEWKITDKFIWSFGLRQYWVKSKVIKGSSTTITEYLSGNRPTETVHSNDKKTKVSDNTLVASSGVTYNISDNTIVRGSFAQGYVYPTLAHLYAVTVAAGQTIYGNPHLKAEKSNNYEIGLRHSSDNWVLDTAIFYSDAKNYITQMACEGQAICNGINGSRSSTYYGNANKAKTYGLELGLEYNRWDIIPYINNNIMRRKIETKSYTTYSTGTPLVNGKIGVKNLHFYPSFDLNSDLYMRFASKVKNRESKTSIENYGGWSALNVSLYAEFGKNREYGIGLDLNNLLNKEYRTAHESIPAARFNAVLSGSLKF